MENERISTPICHCGPEKKKLKSQLTMFFIKKNSNVKKKSNCHA